MISNVKKLKKGGLSYNNVRIEEIPSEKFPNMVQIAKGPAGLKTLIGKKFVSLTKAVLAIDTTHAERLISNSKRLATLGMVDIGVMSIYED
jgi:hypothetical protein